MSDRPIGRPIQWLCSSTIDNQEVHGGTGKCKSLEVLKVRHYVTKKGDSNSPRKFTINEGSPSSIYF